MNAIQKLSKYFTPSASIGVFVVVCATLVIPVATLASSDTITSYNILKLINTQRAKNGLNLLQMSPQLQKAAENKAHDMVLRKYFSHKDPNGQQPWHWITQTSYEYAYAGENLAIGFDSALSQQLAWMKSPLHQRNIINKDYMETGIAVVRGTLRDKEEFIVVQLFATPVSIPPIATKKSPLKQSSNTSVSPLASQPAPLPTIIIGSKQLAIHTIILWLFLLSETIIAITVAWQTIKPHRFTQKILPPQLRAQH